MAELTAKKRAKIPESKFALPDEGKYPLIDAAHVRNAAARLEQAKDKGDVTPAQYKEAKANIAKAAKQHGIESQYLEKKGAKGKK